MDPRSSVGGVLTGPMPDSGSRRPFWCPMDEPVPGRRVRSSESVIRDDRNNGAAWADSCMPNPA